jgi:hypothetical protein
MDAIINSAQVNKKKQLPAACAKPRFDGKNYGKIMRPTKQKTAFLMLPNV